MLQRRVVYFTEVETKLLQTVLTDIEKRKFSNGCFIYLNKVGLVLTQHFQMFLT